MSNLEIAFDRKTKILALSADGYTIYLDKYVLDILVATAREAGLYE